MKNKSKFVLTTESKIALDGTKLYRIKALIEGKYYRKGELGGFVESLKLKNGTDRISGDAWISGNAQVFGDARIFDNAWVFGHARIFGNAHVSEDARISGNAWIFGDAWVYGNARIFEGAQVFGDAQVSGRFDLTVSCDFELPRITIDTTEKLLKLKKFLEDF